MTYARTTLGMLAAGVTLAACSSTPTADSVDWSPLPDGTQEWVAAAEEAGLCWPLKETMGYVAFMEQPLTEPSDLGTYLREEFERRDCTTPTPADEAYLTAIDQVTAENAGEFSGENNPLFHGPGCIGVLKTMDDIARPPADADYEALLTRIMLAADATLASLPAGVTKSGDQEPTASEAIAMQYASALIDLGDAFTDQSENGDQALQTAMGTLQNLQTLYVGACATEYGTNGTIRQDPSPAP